MNNQHFYEEENIPPEMTIVTSEVKLVSLDPEKDRPWMASPSGNRRWLELVFYNKHTLYPILEEGTHWDQPEGKDSG